MSKNLEIEVKSKEINLIKASLLCHTINWITFALWLSIHFESISEYLVKS